MELLYLNYVLSFFISVLLSRFLISQILHIAFEKKLFDSEEERKVHKGIIPRLGGVAFYPTFILSLFLTICVNFVLKKSFFPHLNIALSQEWMFGLCSVTLLHLTGLKDDLMGVRYREKFIIQIAAAGLFIASGLWINNLYGLFGIYELPALIGIPFTIFLIVFTINAFNLIDGIDGLASGISMIAFFLYGVVFSHLHLYSYSILSFIAFGALIPFFIYNVYGKAEKKQKIFMGDCGSLTIGMLISMFMIKLSHFSPDAVHTSSPYTIVIAFSVLAVPILDVVRVVFHRARCRQHLFKPDKNHIHHKFLSLGFSHRTAMISILSIAFLISAANIFAVFHININLILLADLLIWGSLNLYLTIKIKSLKMPSFMEKEIIGKELPKI